MKKNPEQWVLPRHALKKSLRMIRWSLFFFCIGIIQVFAVDSYSQQTRFSMKFESEVLENVLNEIENQSEYYFLYNQDYVDVDQKVNITVSDQKIDELLNQLLKSTGIEYTIQNRQIVLTSSVNPVFSVQGKSIKVSGKVTDTTGAPLPGVTIVVKGTTNGIITNFDGVYSLSNVPADGIIQFSFVGMKTLEIPVAGKTSIDVVMEEDAIGIEEVVVTSFGIKKTLKELTYSTQEIEGENLSTVGNTNVLQSLQGKTAGVSIKLTSGMPGRSPEIKIRGSRSINGNNEPLYVVDGLPIANKIDDIDPNDIESLTVLKGPAASALYGLRASNGVIIITTKNGSKGNGTPVVSLNTSYNVDKVAYLPDLQTSYAQGANGVFNPNSPFSWGPLISEMGTYTNQAGEQEIAKSYDNDKDFYKTGYTSNTNLSISNAGEIGSYMVSMGYNDQKGIVPGTKMKRVTIKLNGEYKLSENLKATVSFNYTDQDVNDYPDLTGNANYFRSLTDVPPSYNLAGTPTSTADDEYKQRYFRSTQNNPYWVVEHNYRSNITKRTFGNIFLEYKISNDLKLNYRVGLDHYNRIHTDFRDLGTGDVGRTNPPSGGYIGITTGQADQITSNIYASYNKSINDNFKLDIIVGNELFDSRSKTVGSYGSDLVTGGWDNLANATTISVANSEGKQRIVGFYSNINVGWQEKVFLNLSGRNDFVSNMPSENRSFFYPSIGSSVILTEIIPSLKNVISFGKLRASAAEVGQVGSIYVNNTGYIKNNPGGFIFPFNGLASWTQSTSRINPNLKPENTRTFETGLDLRFFDNRISIDYTYFNSVSKNQIFSVPLPYSTGATSEIRNAGEISSDGHEIVLSLIPVKTNDLVWTLSANYSALNNKVKKLADGVDRIVLNSVIVAEEGYDYPSILGQSYYKDPETNEILIESDSSSSRYGFPILNSERTIIGSAKPDFEMSFNNELKYRNFSFSFQVDWRHGGKIFSQSYIETRWRGTGGVTKDRDEEVVIKGKKGHITSGNIAVEGDNDIKIKKNYAYYTAIGAYNPTEESLQDASFVRLREVALHYELPKTIYRNTFIKKASVNLTGRNLLLFTKSFTDPEIIHSDGRSSNTEGLEWSNIPQTKSLGIGLNIKF